jgi:predicted Rossmann fold nucleotide-binding protein DprA/Smf involved in DNA uptake
MNVAVVGSRTFTDYARLKKELDQQQNIVKIISGGARGADRLAARYARENQIPLQEFLPDWKTHGRKAGILRNRDIIKNADAVVAFWDGKSRGTQNSIELAEKSNKKLYVHRFSI